MRKLVVAASMATLLLAGCTDQAAQDTIRTSAKGGFIGGGVGLVHGALTGDPVKGAAHGVVLGATAGALVGAAGHLFDDGRGGYADGDHYDNGGYDDGYRNDGYQNGGYPQQGGYYGAQASGPQIDPRTGYRLPPPEYRRY